MKWNPDYAGLNNAMSKLLGVKQGCYYENMCTRKPS